MGVTRRREGDLSPLPFLKIEKSILIFGEKNAVIMFNYGLNFVSVFFSMMQDVMFIIVPAPIPGNISCPENILLATLGS